MQNLGLLTPELILSGLALLVMFADMLLPRSKSRWLYHLAWLSSAAGVARAGVGDVDTHMDRHVGRVGCPHASDAFDGCAATSDGGSDSDRGW